MMNLTQSTYNRIKARLDESGDSWKRRAALTDVRDLLEAYESAVTLLDNLVAVSHNAYDSSEQHEAEEFLYHQSGEPRVVVDDAADLSYSARGLLQPESDDYQP